MFDKLTARVKEIGSKTWSVVGPHDEKAYERSWDIIQEDLRNSREIQKKIIESTKVHPVSDLPASVVAAHGRFRTMKKAGLKEYASDQEDGSTIECLSSSSDADHIIILNSPEKTPFADETQRIEHYYIVDTKSKKMVDLRDVWDTAARLRNINIIPVMTNKYIDPRVLPPSELGMYVVLNRFDRALNQGTVNRESAAFQIPNLNAIVPPHEIAHATQLRSSNLPLNIALSLAEVTKFMLKVLTIVGVKSAFRFAEFSRATSRLYERNAHAFALNMIRTLRKQNLNPTPGLTSKELIFAVNSALRTYDFGYDMQGVKGVRFSKQGKKLFSEM